MNEVKVSISLLISYYFHGEKHFVSLIFFNITTGEGQEIINLVQILITPLMSTHLQKHWW